MTRVGGIITGKCRLIGIGCFVRGGISRHSATLRSVPIKYFITRLVYVL